tara:strand:- start:2727 stop:3287 length:561 start_codon:yes stop_codon:yes gene_type:complete
MGKISKAKRAQLRALHRLGRERAKQQRPVRLAIVMLMGKNEYITEEQEEIADRWVERERWLEASNISLLYEQGHKITDEQRDTYEAWQLAKRDVMAHRAKHSQYLRPESYHTELIANPETSRECPCCKHTYTVCRTHTSKWIKKCMMCESSCRPGKGCSIIRHYEPEDYQSLPFPLARNSDGTYLK